jgi:hypothetical protein
MAMAVLPRLQPHTRHFYRQSIRFHTGPLGKAWPAAEREADQITEAIMDCAELLVRRPRLLEDLAVLGRRTPEQSDLFPLVTGRMDRLAQAWREAGRRVVVFGTGPWARAVLAHTGLRDCRIAGILDSNPAIWGTPWLDWWIQGPGDLPDLAADCIVVTSPRYQEDMARQVHALVGDTAEVVRLFPSDF